MKTNEKPSITHVALLHHPLRTSYYSCVELIMPVRQQLAMACDKHLRGPIDQLIENEILKHVRAHAFIPGEVIGVRDATDAIMTVIYDFERKGDIPFKP